MSQFKLVLDVNSLSEEFFEDTCLFGVQITAGIHRLVWQVNEMIGFRFQIDYDKQIKFIHRERDYYYNVYAYREDAMGLDHYIYTNAYDGEFLIPDLQYFDCLWLMKGEALPPPDERNLLQTAIRSLPDVQMITEMSTEKIKMRERLIL